MRKFLAFLAAAAGYIGGLAAYIIIVVHGIILVFHGAQAKPAQGGTIAWGLVDVFVLASIVATACVFAGILLAVALQPTRKSLRRARARRMETAQRHARSGY